MKIVIQRVIQASVSVEDAVIGKIDQGLLLLAGFTQEDTESDLDYMVDKVLHLRIFEDDHGKMNRSVSDIGGQILSVPQFTLYGDCRKGRRPSFIEAARPDQAIPLYEQLNQKLKKTNLMVETGRFGADMKVSLVNDGPVTILLDSKKNCRRLGQ